MDPVEARHLFPLAARYIHMNHAGVSPMSQRAGAAVDQVVDASINPAVQRPLGAGRG